MEPASTLLSWREEARWLAGWLADGYGTLYVTLNIKITERDGGGLHGTFIGRMANEESAGVPPLAGS